jgi:hypothetical protein
LRPSRRAARYSAPVRMPDICERRGDQSDNGMLSRT